LAYCRYQADNSRPHSAGGTEGDHKKALIEQGFLDPEPETELPEEFWPIYDIYFDLKYTRASSVRNDEVITVLIPVESITFEMITAYSKLYGRKFERWEIDLIRRADATQNYYSRC